MHSNLKPHYRGKTCIELIILELKKWFLVRLDFWPLMKCEMTMHRVLS
jgi:hypothetical protein